MKLRTRLAILLGLSSFFALFFVSATAVHALPSDAWFANYGNNAGSIAVATSGNGLGDNNVLRLVTTAPSNGQVFYTFQGVALYAPNSVSDKNNVANQCTITLTAVVSSSNPGSARFYVAAGSPLLGGSNNQPCGTSQLNEAKSKFDQKDQSVGQVATFNALLGQGGGTLPQLKSVTINSIPLVEATPGAEPDTSVIPQSDTLSIKNSAGTVVATKVAQASILTGNTSTPNNPATVSVHYQATLDNIAAGSYQACSVVVNKCQPFTKSDSQTASVTIQGDEDTKLAVTTASSEDEANSCENKGGPLGWIMCPITRAIDASLGWVDDQIAALLEINNSALENSKLHQSWAQIRNIALLALVPMMLVMIISTALGFEFFDAYTVKRALPRFIIAILFITLSWEICIFLISFFNAVGEGVMGVITFPFRSSGHGPVNELTLSALTTGSILQGLLAVPLIGAILVLLWLFLSSILLFAAIGFLVLLLRQILIVALVMAAPLAIIAWIFPGNDKLWKYWWGLFSKLLIMFPLIMALLATGRIFAIIIHDGGANGTGLNAPVLNQIAVMVVWMLPYAMIPLTYKFAGGVFATLTGVVNDKGKGLFDRSRQGRANKLERTAAGKAFKPGGKLSGLNRPFAAATHVRSGGLNVFKARGRIRQTLTTNAMEEAGEAREKSAPLRAIFGNDDFLEAGRRSKQTNADGSARDGSEKAIKQYLSERGYKGRDLDQGVAAIRAAQRGMSQQAFDIAAVSGITGSGTGFKGGAGEMYAAINDAAGGDRNLAARMYAENRGIAERARRPDLVGGGFNAGRETLQAQFVAGDTTEAIKFSSDHMDDLTLERQDSRSVMSAKPDTIKRLAPRVVERFTTEMQAAPENFDEANAIGAAAQLSVLRSQLAYYPEEVRTVIATQLTAAGVDLGSTSTVDQQLAAKISSRSDRSAEQLSSEIRTRAGAYENAQQFNVNDQRGQIEPPPSPQ